VERPFEKVYTMTDYYDGPRRGIADFDGRPHFYDSEWDDLDATRHPHGATNFQDDGARWGNSTTEGSGVTSAIGSRALSGARALAAAEQRFGLGHRSRRRRPVLFDAGLEA
jgi:hypothetical protein